MTEEYKVCKECKKRLEANTDYFRSERGGRLHAICKMCESKKRHSEDRWKHKAQTTIAYHRLRALEEYQITPEKFPSWDGRYKTFAKIYGWDAAKIAGEMEALYEGPCRICGRIYKDMGHGRHDLTVDIIEPASEPFYNDNTRLVCGSCNSRKGSKSRDEERRASKAYQTWLETSCTYHQLSFSLIPRSLGVLPNPPVESKAIPAQKKSLVYRAGEHPKLF